jgi:hypothetical protein
MLLQSTFCIEESIINQITREIKMKTQALAFNLISGLHLTAGFEAEKRDGLMKKKGQLITITLTKAEAMQIELILEGTKRNLWLAQMKSIEMVQRQFLFTKLMVKIQIIFMLSKEIVTGDKTLTLTINQTKMDQLNAATAENQVTLLKNVLLNFQLSDLRMVQNPTATPKNKIIE